LTFHTVSTGWRAFDKLSYAKDINYEYPLKQNMLKYYPKESAKYDTDAEPPASTAKILDAVSKSAYDNDRAYEGCCRCVLDAIERHLRLVDDDKSFKAALKASTGLAAGIAREGETCGALIGAIMAAGLVSGTEHLDDFQGYENTMEASGTIFDRFKSYYGTVCCSEIQKKLLGRRYDFRKEKDRKAWYKDGGLDACPGVCAVAARIGAEVVLKLKKM
jgi:C_GCAxxG_C_C family probable redox protein